MTMAEDPPVEAAADDTTPKPRKRRTRRPAADVVGERLKERGQKIERTLRELIRLRKPDLDVDGLSFLEVVERDARAWGSFLAQVGEWVNPFGQLVDLIFGQPILLLVGLAPSVRAARRDLVGRRQQRRLEAEQAAEAAAAELEQQWGTE